MTADTPLDLDAIDLTEVRAATIYCYEAGEMPPGLSEATERFMVGDGGLLNLVDYAAALVAEVRRLREAVTAINYLHVPDPRETGFCQSCGTGWPCATSRTLNETLAAALGGQ